MLGVWALRFYTSIRNQRDLWFHILGLDSKHYTSLFSPELQEGVLRVITFASELVPQALIWCPTFRIYFKVADNLFSSSSTYFYHIRNKSLTFVIKTLWGVFCSLCGGHKHSQLHTLSNTFIWSDTPFFWNIYKTNLSLNAGWRFHKESFFCEHLRGAVRELPPAC